MKRHLKILGVVGFMTLSMLIIISCSGKINGTWEGYWDGDYMIFQFTGSKWVEVNWNGSGSFTVSGNTITLKEEDGSVVGTGNIAGNGMTLNYHNRRASLTKK